MKIKAFFDERTFTITYIVWDEKTKDGVLIDSVLDYEPVGSRLWTESFDEYTAFIDDEQIHIHYLLETHAHADHISAAPFLKKKYPQARIVIGSHIREVQNVFKDFFNLKELQTDGRQFDILLDDGDEIEAGSIKIKALHTPGHTPACLSYLIEDALFTGDALFMPDYGTGRCDFPKGDARALYRSIIDKIYSLPDKTRIFVGHDYLPDGRELKYETTVGQSKKENIWLPAERSEEDFVSARQKRDAGLSAPRLLYQSVMANINGGGLPEADDNGKAYFKLPANLDQ